MTIGFRGKVIAGTLTFLTGIMFAACGDGSNQGTGASVGVASGGVGGAGGAGGAGNGSLAGPSGSGGDITVGVGIGGGSTGAGGAEICAGETSKAELVPLDMYIMLDKSGSMLENTGLMGEGDPKWDAVTQGLTAFFKDPQSAGLGVALQYFPLLGPGVPETCTSNAQCPGTSGPCLLKGCSGQQTIVSCTNNANCPSGSSCVNLGQCANDPNYFCYQIGAACGGNKGNCVQVYSSFCLNQDTCDPGVYAEPAVEFEMLNGASDALESSIATITPKGGTPTAPALAGAIEHAAAWATANPTHAVVAVLATDGLPTECSPTDIPGISQIAANGVNGSPSILTFVIGVFAGNNTTAKQNLDTIAAAGGTQQAFFIDAGQNVTQAFIDALNEIRGTKLECEYLIPEPPPGEKLDYGKVNVEHTPPGADKAVTIFYVPDAMSCNATTGGWYYDVDPSKGGTPTTILMCPATCSSFSMGGGQVDIRLGCETQIEDPQ